MIIRPPFKQNAWPNKAIASVKKFNVNSQKTILK